MHRKQLFVLLIVCLAFTLLFPTVASAETIPAFKHTDWAFSDDYTKVTVDGKTYDNYIVSARFDDGSVFITNLAMEYLSNVWKQNEMSPDQFFNSSIKDRVEGHIFGFEVFFPSQELVEINWKPWQETEFASYNMSLFEAEHPDGRNYDSNELKDYLENKNANGSAFDHYTNKVSIENSIADNSYKNAPAEMLGTYKTSTEFFANKGHSENTGTVKKSTYSELKTAVVNNVSVAESAHTPILTEPIPVGIELNLCIGTKEMTKLQNDQSLQIPLDAPPYLSASGNTMVPVRAVADCFGIAVDWDPVTQQVKLDNSRIVLTMGSTQALMADSAQSLAEGPAIVNGRTFVPLRFVSEVLGYQVEWKAETKGIRISK